jgi:hypothetical protein
MTQRREDKEKAHARKQGERERREARTWGSTHNKKKDK